MDGPSTTKHGIRQRPDINPGSYKHMYKTGSERFAVNRMKPVNRRGVYHPRGIDTLRIAGQFLLGQT